MAAYACLVPYTRPKTLQVAVDSARLDGWDVLTMQDRNRDGVNKIREALLARAFADETIEFIRYLDDDDRLLPHLGQVKKVFEENPKVDIVYLDAVLNMPSGIQHDVNYSGDPLEDAMRVHPWSWVARVSALRDIKRIWGHLWDYSHPCREGNYCWLKFLKSNLVFQHLPIQGYFYNKSFDPVCISQHPSFGVETRKLEQNLQEFRKLIRP